MLGLILASSIVINCTVVNFDPQPTLTCSDKTTRYISYADWPENWHGPELGFTYQYEIQDDGKVFTLPSVRDEERLVQDIRQARFHQRRWMRESLQNPKKE